MFTLFQNRKTEVASAIASIEAQILKLQQRLVEEQAFLQELGTVEQAGQSAINQAMTFLSMVRAIDPSQEAVFWQAMDALKQGDVRSLTSEITSEIETDAPQAETEAIETVVDDADEQQVTDTDIEVTATPVSDTDDDTIVDADTSDAVSNVQSEAQEEEDADKPVLKDASPALTASQLKVVPWDKLKKLAGDRNIVDPTGQRLTRKFIEGKLLGVLTQADIA